MTRAALTGFAAILTASAIFLARNSSAQQPKHENSPQFDVATIKPGDPHAIGASSSWDGKAGGRFQFQNVPLKQWVETGFSIRDYALKAPSWLDTARFDLNARVPAGMPDKPVDGKTTAEMVKSLLIERFGLKWHEEVQNVSGYALVPDKKVLLKPAGMIERLLGQHGSSSGPTSIGGTNMPMSELAEELGVVLGKPVVDATHLSDGYDIDLKWSPTDAAAVTEQKKYGIDVDNLPSSLPAALREQLGLRLQSSQVPSKVVVVDHINNQPTEN
jgi:uncharacterized protein (TIGR03435 family)